MKKFSFLLIISLIIMVIQTSLTYAYDLSGYWSYIGGKGGEGECILIHHNNVIVMELTWSPKKEAVSPPHYKATGTISGDEILITFDNLEKKCSGTATGKIVNSDRIEITTEGERCKSGWANTVFTKDTGLW